MTGNNSIFLNIDTSIKSQVRMGNGALVNAKGKGTISVETKRGVLKLKEELNSFTMCCWFQIWSKIYLVLDSLLNMVM